MKDDNIVFNTELIEFKVNEFLNVEGWHSFHKDTKESYFRKILSNKWDIIVNWSINLGNHHFAITINMPNDVDFDMKTSLFNYDNFELEWYSEIENEIRDTIFNNFPTTTFVFIVSEKNKKGIIHFHCLVGIRNFIDYNYILKNNLILLFKEFTGNGGYLNMSAYDIKIESLLYFKDVKNWAIYMYKDMYNWKLYSVFYIIDKYNQDIIINNLGDITWFFLQINCKIEPIKNNKNVELEGIKLTYNIINQRTLINILQYYLILNNYFIFNNDIYEKIKESVISYKLIGSINEVLYDKFQENVVSFFVINYTYYFYSFDFNYLISSFFIKAKQVIESIKDITTNKIAIDFSILEFNDGIYYMKSNRFIEKKNINNTSVSNQATVKYYKKSYNRVRQDKPLTWIKGLSYALNIKDNENIENNEEFRKIYTSYAGIFQEYNAKQSTLFVFGVSNSGKTTLIVNPLINFFGNRNLGWVVSSKAFKWQNLINKIVGIIDEGRYSPSISSDLLKITGQEVTIVEKKYSKEHVEIKPLPLFILTNDLFKDNNETINEAFYNRMKQVEFHNIVPNKDLKDSKSFKERVKNEEANIFIYCNKLYFKILKEKNKKQLKVKKDFKKIN